MLCCDVEVLQADLRTQFGVFRRISDTVWRTPANMWPEMLNLQDQNVPWPLPASCHFPSTSPLMIKLCFYTFKWQMLQWLKLTLPLACALDLAALENIPSLSFRNVYRYQPGEMKLFSVLILIPRCLRLRSIVFMRSYLIWMVKLILDTLILTKVSPSLIQMQRNIWFKTPNTWRLDDTDKKEYFWEISLLTFLLRGKREDQHCSHTCMLNMNL